MRIGLARQLFNGIVSLFLDNESIIKISKRRFMVKIVNLSKFYGSFAAVEDISLSIEEGVLFGLVGPNGAGKSTLLNILAGLTLPTKGYVTIFGLNSQKDKDSIKNITGYMPDSPFLYNKLNAVEFLNFVGSLYSIPEKILEKRIDRLLDLLGLKEKSYYLIETYSFGMKRKLSFTASIIHKPRLLLLDEPFDGVDPESAFIMKSILKGLIRNNCIVILSTHILDIAQEICEEIGIINRGKLILLGRTEEILREFSSHKLEEVFLELTGGEKYREIVSYLKKEENLLDLF
ncbi:MAG TPA: ABC transporter ATP-binding protein [Caldisericia bacterium]|nr:ABC transporter ATP-binding protein [Caldisericia bacterium]